MRKVMAGTLFKRTWKAAAVAFACMAVQEVRAQDIHFSQFFECAMMRNPALTGIFSGDYKVAVNYRSQWGQYVVPYQTALASAETKVLLREATGDHLSFGLTAAYDRAGSVDLTGVSAFGAVNYNKALGEESPVYLSIGLCGGYIQRSFDITKARTASQFIAGGFSASNPTGETGQFGVIRHFDASAGISLNGALSSRMNYYIGASGYHVSRPQESYFDQSMVRLTTRWSGNFGLHALLDNGYRLTIHANYQYQKPYQEIIGGFLFGKRFMTPDNSRSLFFSAGCFYRYQDAIVPMIRVEYDRWALTSSYDITLPGKRLYLDGFGGYEMTLSLRGDYKHARPNNMMCPRFEKTDIDAGL